MKNRLRQTWSHWLCALLTVVVVAQAFAFNSLRNAYRAELAAPTHPANLCGKTSEIAKGQSVLLDDYSHELEQALTELVECRAGSLTGARR